MSVTSQLHYEMHFSIKLQITFMKYCLNKTEILNPVHYYMDKSITYPVLKCEDI